MIRTISRPPALRRMLWPLVRFYRRLRDREPLLCCDHAGLKLWYPARSEIGAAVAAGKPWDPMLRAIAEDLIGAERGLVVDVGANVGASLLQMKLGAPNSRVWCLEPAHRFAKALAKTVGA